MNITKRIIKWLFKNIFSNMMILFYLIMVFTLLLQVFVRYILKMPLFWTEELARYLYIWFVFIGSGIAFFEESHIKVELFSSRISSKYKKVYQNIINSIIVVYLVIVAWKGFELAIFFQHQITPALQISRLLPYLAIPVGSIIMILGLLYRLFNNTSY